MIVCSVKQQLIILMFDFGSKNQKPTAMGLFKFLEKGANKFFDGLKKKRSR